MRPRGFSSATRAAGRSWRTIWQKTFCSRTRRAISWPYCAPKSRIRIRSLSGCLMAGCRLLVGELGNQLLQDRFVVNVAVTDEAFHVHGAILEKINLPILARNSN